MNEPKITKIEELTKVGFQYKGCYQYLGAELVNILERECPKSEDGKREESYSNQILRLIAPAIKRAEREKERTKKAQYIECE